MGQMKISYWCKKDWYYTLQKEFQVYDLWTRFESLSAHSQWWKHGEYGCQMITVLLPSKGKWLKTSVTITESTLWHFDWLFPVKIKYAILWFEFNRWNVYQNQLGSSGGKWMFIIVSTCIVDLQWQLTAKSILYLTFLPLTTLNTFD